MLRVAHSEKLIDIKFSPAFNGAEDVQKLISLSSADAPEVFMAKLRWLQAVAIFGLLVLIVTAWVYKFDVNGYRQTLASLRASIDGNADIFIALFSVVSMISMPIVGISGIVGIALSSKLGRPALILGIACCALSFANYLLWRNYGGVPH